MLKNFDEMQKMGKDNMDVAMKSFGAVSKGMQASFIFTGRATDQG